MTYTFFVTLLDTDLVDKIIGTIVKRGYTFQKLADPLVSEQEGIVGAVMAFCVTVEPNSAMQFGDVFDDIKDVLEFHRTAFHSLVSVDPAGMMLWALGNVTHADLFELRKVIN